MNRKKSAPEERGYQRCAFEIYLALGNERSYAAVAETLGMSTSAIKHWARIFDWRIRANRRIAWQAEDTPAPTDNTQLEQVERTIRFIDAALARMLTHLAEGKLRASPQDLMALHRLEEQISERINQCSGNREKANQVRILIPDNNHDGADSDRRVIPESQLKEYLDYLDYRT